MKSMTGYGKGTASADNKNITIEVKSVNNRYLEINSRIPKSLLVCDEIVRKCIQRKIKRGSVDVFFNYENNSENKRTLSFDYPLAREFIRLAESMNSELGIENDFCCSSLMRIPEITSIETTVDDGSVLPELVQKCAEEAVESLEMMRIAEGATVKKDLLELIFLLEADTRLVIDRAPVIVEEYRSKLTARIKDTLKGVDIDETKLLNEVAFFADKADVNEELSRLSSHFVQFKEAVESDDAVGRKLDFISQEINRELNTIGSKSNDLTATNLVLAMKNNLERIKEQIRNIE